MISAFMNPDMMPEMHDMIYTADDWKLTRALAIGWLAECANNFGKRATFTGPGFTGDLTKFRVAAVGPEA